MSQKIHVLSEQTINQIAAGEVIENPSSVVKELVDNAIDAGATEISVSIQGGGRQCIRVEDNGSGMAEDDALLCLERHATSKIHAVEDIAQISSMGFRGEAIPSIAAISKLMILTRQVDAPQATLVMVEGGTILKCEAAERSAGTRFEVKSLFFNVPVRQRFQRSPNYDTQEIQRVLTQFALAHPRIHFKLSSNGSLLLNTPKLPPGEELACLKTRIDLALGPDYLPQALAVQVQEEDFSLLGWISPPQLTRPNRGGQQLFINHRAVQSAAISYAVRDGYGTRLAQRRQPLFVLHLGLPTENVDINVHPQKREVRLRHELDLKHHIEQAIDRALQQGGALPAALPDPAPAAEPTSESLPPAQESPVWEGPALSWADQAELAVQEEAASLSAWAEIRDPDPVSSGQEAPIEALQEEPAAPVPVPAELDLSTPSELRRPPRVLGTLRQYILVDAEETADYLLCSTDDPRNGLVIVDQRLAHARILFEAMQREAQDGQTPHYQRLLLPVQIPLSSYQRGICERHLSSLAAMGMELELTQEGVEITGLAAYLADQAVEALFEKTLEDLSQESSPTSCPAERLRQLATSASRAALSRTRKLDCMEAQSLLNQLFECESPFHCPLGQPVMAHLNLQQLEQLFRHPAS
jgi:DNA mismatch repair protein MutL